MNLNTIPRQDLPLDDKPALLVGDEDRNPDGAEFEKAIFTNRIVPGLQHHMLGMIVSFPS